MKSNVLTGSAFAGLCLVAILSSNCACASSTDSASVLKAIQALYVSQDSAFDHKDLNAYFATQTPDYISTTKTGKQMDNDDERPILTKMLAMATVTSQSSKVISIKLEADGVMATVESSGEMTFVRQSDQKTADVVVSGIYHDFWVKSGNSWLEKSSTELSNKTTVNGKPVAE